MKKILLLVLLVFVFASCTKKPAEKPDLKLSGVNETVEKAEASEDEKSETVGLPEIGKVITFDTAYIYEDSRDPIKPSLNLNLVEKRFSFTYSGFSSYMPMGNFDLKDGKLFLKADGGEQYVFNMTEEGLVFDAKSSSAIPTYKVSGDSEERYSPVPDGALFKRHIHDNPTKEYGVTEYGGYVKRVGSDEKIKMSDEDANALAETIFAIEWKEGVTDCVFDVWLDINGRMMKYHSSCGSLCFVTPTYVSHTKPEEYSFVLSEEERMAFNSVIEKYIEIGEDIVDK